MPQLPRQVTPPPLAQGSAARPELGRRLGEIDNPGMISKTPAHRPILRRMSGLRLITRFLTYSLTTGNIGIVTSLAFG